MGQTEKLLGLPITAFTMQSSPDELAVTFAFLLQCCPNKDEGFVIRLASEKCTLVIFEIWIWEKLRETDTKMYPLNQWEHLLRKCSHMNICGLFCHQS